MRGAGIEFSVRPAHVDEAVREGEPARDYARRLAEAKARSVHRRGETVLGADTVVVLDGALLGKPADEADARRMLRMLSGREHEVLTGICLLSDRETLTAVESTKVKFLELGDGEIDAYVATGEPLDKAGAYGIQGAASKFIERIEGCYFNVVGLPIARVYGFMRSSLR